MLGGLQAQGDLFVVPVPSPDCGTMGCVPVPVPAEGIAVIEAVAGGHEHRLFASEPGTAFFHSYPGHRGQVIGAVECMASAYLLHPEHGATGLAPGAYELRRQREQAGEERLVAD